MPDRFQHFVVISAGVVIALLIVANLLLLKTVKEIQHPGAGQTAADNSAPLPDLPDSSNGESSKALVREIDRTKREFRTPLDETLGQLQSLNGNTASLGGFSGTVQQMALAAESLGESASSLPGLAKQFRSMNRKMRQLLDFMLGLGPVLTDFEQSLHAIQNDVSRIRQCEEKSPGCS